jgi:hypothetical protein
MTGKGHFHTCLFHIAEFPVEPGDDLFLEPRNVRLRDAHAVGDFLLRPFLTPVESEPHLDDFALPRRQFADGGVQELPVDVFL